MLTTILAYILVSLFTLLEGNLRKGQPDQTFTPGASDRRSTLFVSIAYAVAVISLLCAPFLNNFSIGYIPLLVIGWIGILISIGGIVLRMWANRTLGAFYTRTLKVLDDQSVVQNGPYRFIRHPGYLGTILMWVGAGLAVVNWIVTLCVLLILCIAYYYRIRTEEAMLLEQLGQPYADYQAHTWRLLPYIY
jgi:protein-S-isoprenylcysteine O-methyltransferase Ste14